MKITVISPSTQHLHSIATALQARGHVVTSAEGGKSRMGEMAARDQPELMLVDGICRDPAELTHVEQVVAQHPATAVILLCSSQTPEFLLQAMRAGVREVLPSPVAAEDLQAAVDRLEARTRKAQGPQGKILAFMACKGGSGATFVATNLGWELAENQRVLLVDLNLQFGDALSFVHDGPPVATLTDVTREIRRLDASLLANSVFKLTPTYHVLAAPDDLAHGTHMRAEDVTAILKLAVTQYEHVLLDLPRSLDSQTVAALDLAWRIYPVMQASVPDLRHAGRLIAAFRQLGYGADKVAPIVNRFDKSAAIGLDEIRKALGTERVDTVPNAWREVHASINQGEPLARSGRGSSVVRQLAELARNINPRQDEGRGILNRLFRRA